MHTAEWCCRLHLLILTLDDDLLECYDSLWIVCSRLLSPSDEHTHLYSTALLAHHRPERIRSLHSIPSFHWRRLQHSHPWHSWDRERNARLPCHAAALVYPAVHSAFSPAMLIGIGVCFLGVGAGVFLLFAIPTLLVRGPLHSPFCMVS